MSEQIIILPAQTEVHYWRELWRYRELLYFFTWRNIIVRYKQTLIGVGWAVFRPLISTFVLTLVLGRLAKLPSGGVPYPLLVFAGLLPWQLFASALANCTLSLVSNAALVAKVYFPRTMLPVSALLANLLDFAISLALLACLMAYYGFGLRWEMVFLPAFVLLALVATTGTGLWLAALNVKYRDVGHIVPFVTQLGFYLSPVGYSAAVVPEAWRPLYWMNPAVGVLEGFRWSLLGSGNLYLPGMAVSVLLALVIFLGGLWYFRATERTFADVI